MVYPKRKEFASEKGSTLKEFAHENGSTLNGKDLLLTPFSAGRKINFQDFSMTRGSPVTVQWDWKQGHLDVNRSFEQTLPKGGWTAGFV